MHKSRLSGLIIDCKTENLGAAAEFWSRALGMPTIARPVDEPSPEKYVHLENPANHLDVEIQKVPHPSRVHLDRRIRWSSSWIWLGPEPSFYAEDA